MAKKRIDTELLTPVEVYKLVLSGELKIFPMYFWEKPDSMQSAKEITIYLIEEILKWTENDIKEKFNKSILKDNKLGGMLYTCFKDSPFAAIDNAYPNKFLPWHLKTPNNYWNNDTGREATRWLIEEQLKWDEEDIKTKLDAQVFSEYNLRGMLKIIYHNSPYDAINSLYPDKFLPWQLKCTPMNYWKKDTGIMATKWLIEEHLKWNDEDIKDKLNAQVFIDYGLKGMMTTLYKNSPYEALNSLYPNKFKKEDLKSYNINGKY